MQAIAETLKDGEPEHPETDPASALLVGDEHDLTVGYALEMLAVGAHIPLFCRAPMADGVYRLRTLNSILRCRLSAS